MANLFFRTNIAPYRVDTYNALHERLDCKMFFMSRNDSSQDFKLDKIESRCRFTPGILKKGRFFGLPYYKGIWKLIRENQPEVIIVPEFKLITIQALVYKYLFNKKIKVVSMCDDSYDMVANGKDFTRIHTLARKIVTPLLDDLLLVNDEVCSWYRNNYGKGQWMPIIRDEKVEVPLYKKAENISTRFVEKYDLKGKRVLLFIGRLVEVKNLPTLIKAIGLTKTEFTTVLIGDGPLLENLKNRAEKTGKDIRFLGRFEDEEIRAWCNIGNVFILPSTQEAFGAVTNEALLAGCFTMVSKACGSTCLIDESNGIVFDPLDPEKLAELIDRSFDTVSREGSKLGNRMNLNFNDSVVKVIENLKNS